MTETCWGGQITCNGAQDSSWQRGRQAISRSISSKESNRSIIFRNSSRKIHRFRRCYITQLICNTCNNWSTTQMNFKTCFLYFFSSRCFGNHIAKGLSWGTLSFRWRSATLLDRCAIPQLFILNYLRWFKFIDHFRYYFPTFSLINVMIWFVFLILFLYFQ